MIRKSLLTVLTAIFLCFSSALATTYYVAPNGDDTDNGTSWSTAFETLSEALATATSDDEIWVAAGTYIPGTTRSSTFQMVSGVDVYGGFYGDETSRSERNWRENETILSGDIGTIDTYTDNCYHVVTGGVGNASLDGFTITKGYADGNAPDCYAGGLFNNIDIYNCIFEDNYASGGGGAAWIYYSNGDIYNCIFRNNSTDGDGGALNLYEVNITFKNNLFYNNSADTAGGIYVNGGNPTFSNCTIALNETVDGDGGGLYFIYCSSDVSVENNIIWGNTATGSGDQIFKHQYCNNPIYTYCNIEDSFDANEVWDTSIGTNGGNNIDIAPEFIDADNGDFHINGDSPCIDAGDNDAIAGCVYDLDWRPRVVDGPDDDATATVDIGAYEHSIIYVDLDAVGDNDGSSWANAYDNINDAIGAAQSGDEIWVANGTYTLTSTINIDVAVSIYGGFDGSGSERADRAPATNTTTIDGDESVRCFYITADTTIDGFEIKDGKLDTNEGVGAGICANRPLNIANCIFNSNEINDTECVYDAYGWLQNVGSTGGGAIYFSSGSSGSLVTNCEFYGNSVNTYSKGARGGAIYAYGGGNDITIVNSLFYENTCTNNSNRFATAGGAILFCHMEQATENAKIINCTFYGNSATEGAGLYISEDSATNNKAVITNCILWNNQNKDILLKWSADVTVTYSDIQGGWSGTGNINSDPIFTYEANGDLTLASSSSPCVDTGYNDAIDGYDYDLAGETRIVDGDESGLPPEVDMGCYEYQTE